MPAVATTPTVTTFSPTIGTPNRGTGERDLDVFNRQLRSSPLYQQFMQKRGLPTNGRVKLSRKQQSDLEKEMARAGFKVPGGMHIDQGGNLNQKNRLVRNAAITAGLAAGTIATLGATGVIGGGVMGGFTGGGAAGVASVPGAVSGVVPTTGAMAGGLGTGTVIGGAGSLAATAAPITASVPLAAAVSPVSSVAGGGMGVPWFDIGKEGARGLFDWIGGRSANKANEKASDVAAQGNADMVAVEREKLAYDREQQAKIDKINERNFQIQQEERMDELRRLNEQEAAREPLRMAKETAYRNYMKKYYGIDVGPSVARTPRQFSTTPTKQPESMPLAAQAAPGAGYGALIAPEAVPAVAPDPFMQSWLAPSSEVTYRRKLGVPEDVPS